MELQGGTEFLFRHKCWQRGCFLPSQLGPFSSAGDRGSQTRAQPERSCEGEAAQLCLRRRRKILIKHSSLDLQPTNTWEMQPTPVWGHLLEQIPN